MYVCDISDSLGLNISLLTNVRTLTETVKFVDGVNKGKTSTLMLAPLAIIAAGFYQIP